MIAILFSFEQKGFHIETLEDYMISNVEATFYKSDHQWRLVRIANSYEEADYICERLSQKEPYKSIINNL